MSSNLLIRRLAVLFGEPKTDDPETFSAEYANALRGVDKDVLKTAGDLIVRERKWRSWPTVADILDVVDRAKAMHNAKARVGMTLTEIPNFDAWWSDLISDVRQASSEAEIQRAIDVMEPYWRAKWIQNGGQKCRMVEIQRHAEIRRCQLAGKPVPPRFEEEQSTPESRARCQQLRDELIVNLINTGRLKNSTKETHREATRRADFAAMQHQSPNAGLHMTAQGLTERSRRMMGERDDAA